MGGGDLALGEIEGLDVLVKAKAEEPPQPIVDRFRSAGQRRLGLIAGAACGEVPEELKTGLADRAALTEEIDAFAEVACAERRLF